MDILNLTSLLPLLADIPAYAKLAESIRTPGGMTRANVIDAARPFLVASLHHDLQRPVLLVTSQAETARKLYDQLCIWNDPAQVRLLPEPDSLPYERITSDNLTELETLRVLASLVRNGALLVVASAHAFCMKQPSARDFTAAFYAVEEGSAAEPAALMRKWQMLGYQVESVVEVPGTMGRRGGIIDIDPPTSEFLSASSSLATRWRASGSTMPPASVLCRK